ncbi:unnamed protein product, partial [marine sediment metagenome]
VVGSLPVLIVTILFVPFSYHELIAKLKSP